MPHTQVVGEQELTISTTKAHSTGGDELQMLLGLLARMVDAKLSCMYLVARGGHPVLELKATYHGKAGKAAAVSGGACPEARQHVGSQ